MYMLCSLLSRLPLWDTHTWEIYFSVAVLEAHMPPTGIPDSCCVNRKQWWTQRLRGCGQKPITLELSYSVQELWFVGKKLLAGNHQIQKLFSQLKNVDDVTWRNLFALFQFKLHLWICFNVCHNHKWLKYWCHKCHSQVTGQPRSLNFHFISIVPDCGRKREGRLHDGHKI